MFYGDFFEKVSNTYAAVCMANHMPDLPAYYWFVHIFRFKASECHNYWHP